MCYSAPQEWRESGGIVEHCTGVPQAAEAIWRPDANTPDTVYYAVGALFGLDFYVLLVSHGTTTTWADQFACAMCLRLTTSAYDSEMTKKQH